MKEPTHYGGGDPFEETRKLIAEWDAIHNGEIPQRFHEFDWLALRDKDYNYDWLVEKWWPVETHMHIFAAPKTGKSLLMLWVAANIALGRDPFTWESIKRQHVAYIDNEMTEKDVIDRLTDMGIAFEELVGWLHYFAYPAIAPMDTASGGLETLDLMKAFNANVLIIDTLSRVVKGEENSNDTYRNFYNHTGRLLKANGNAMSRMDHTGHAMHKSRGASAKADDVDLVYELERRSGKDDAPGYRLTRTHARIGNVSEIIELALTDEPLSIKATNTRTWSEQAIRKAKELDAIGVPLNASVRETQRLLRVANLSVGKTGYLMEALKLRADREPFRQFGL